MKLPPSLLDVSLRDATNEVVVESEAASKTEVAVEAEFMLPPEPGMTAIIVTQLDEFTSSYSDNCLSSAKKLVILNTILILHVGNTGFTSASLEVGIV